MNQQSQPTSLYPVERGDELSLIELWKVLVEYKLLIIVFTVLTTLVASYYSYKLPNVYMAEVLMIPTSFSGNETTRGANILESLGATGIGSSSNLGEEAFTRLKTRTFLINYIKNNNLKPALFPSRWSDKEKQWINKEPTDIAAAKFLKGMISGGMHKRHKVGLTSLFITWKNPTNINKIADIANSLADEMNYQAKKREITHGKSKVIFLEEAINSTNLLESKKIIFSMIEKQLRKNMLAEIKEGFIFEIVDRALPPNIREEKLTTMLPFIGLVLGVLFGLLTALSINYFKRLV
jgi:hypothetical protein